MPSKLAVKTHWAPYLVSIDKFDCIEEVFESDYCFACGQESTGDIERAHITARCEGGSDSVENIHLLCGFCHKLSEFINGDEYLIWLKEQDAIKLMFQMVAKRNPIEFAKIMMKLSGAK